MNVINFLKAVKGDFRHISWPTREVAMAYTVAIVILTLLVAYYLGLFDWLFSLGLEFILIS